MVTFKDRIIETSFRQAKNLGKLCEKLYRQIPLDEEDMGEHECKVLLYIMDKNLAESERIIKDMGYAEKYQYIKCNCKS